LVRNRGSQLKRVIREDLKEEGVYYVENLFNLILKEIEKKLYFSISQDRYICTYSHIQNNFFGYGNWRDRFSTELFNDIQAYYLEHGSEFIYLNAEKIPNSDVLKSINSYEFIHDKEGLYIFIENERQLFSGINI